MQYPEHLTRSGMKSVSRTCGLFALIFGLLVFARSAEAQASYDFTVAAVKYEGGGDWYQAKSPLPNLLKYVRNQTLMDVAPTPDVVELSGDALFQYPFLFMSGHGNIELTELEAQRLRHYLLNGGFLYIDDDYGLDEHVRDALLKVFPDKELVELPFDHPIYHTQHDFGSGPPKIHKHDDRPPQGFGILHEGELVVYYTFESNVSDGWESPGVHGDPETKRQEALQMGVNILAYALMN